MNDLRELRKKHFKTLDRFAEVLGVDPTTVWCVEKGRRTFNRPVAKLARAIFAAAEGKDAQVIRAILMDDA